MSRSRTVILSFASAGLTAVMCAGFWIYSANERTSQNKEYIKSAQKIERSFLTQVPIYDDFATPQMEMELRKFLLMDHLRVAEAIGVPAIESDEDIKKLVKEGKLIPARIDENAEYHYYNVPAEYRFLTPRAREGLIGIASRFQKNLDKRYSGHPPVRIAISSILRSLGYQKDLQKKNPNASFASSHSYGVSFDIFYDDYYVKLPEPPTGLPDELRTSLGYWLGGSLRRQFKAVLIETLIQLQDEGELYAIIEKNQRCFHVTVLEKK